ncbi:hypothetical protein [Paenibacillus glacialis]|uniref:Uncharacterized protein n=1 Tax=Paenibacillus glacialis TaxID=494026 RepID=A0A168CP87_9BACL|nr:hypothetical protein [Paenibacillus glacialis]OAB33496.1 hypothetical protein PGLA_25345 [Paenibacillus glacialis]
MRIISDKILKLLLKLGMFLAITQLLYVGIANATPVVETIPEPIFKEPYLEGANPGKRQRWVIPVRSWVQSHLVATLYQSDSREWFYDLIPIHYGPFANISKPTGDVPVPTNVEAVIEIDSSLYKPNKVFLDKSGDLKFTVAQVPRAHRNVRYIKAYERDIDDTPPTVTKFNESNGKFTTTMHLGGDTSGTRGEPYQSKSSIGYFINLDILWEGTIIETKEIFVEERCCAADRRNQTRKGDSKNPSN